MFSFFKYFGIPEKNDIFDFTFWHQLSASQVGWKSTIFIPFACCIYWLRKSCNTTNLLHNFSLSKKAQLQENWINLIIYWGTKAECSPTLSSSAAEKNSQFDHEPYLGIQKILDSNNVRIGLSLYVKFGLGKWLSSRQKHLFKSVKKFKITQAVECVTKNYHPIYNWLNHFNSKFRIT